MFNHVNEQLSFLGEDLFFISCIAYLPETTVQKILGIIIFFGFCGVVSVWAWSQSVGVFCNHFLCSATFSRALSFNPPSTEFSVKPLRSPPVLRSGFRKLALYLNRTLGVRIRI